jgi:hypothetical protein
MSGLSPACSDRRSARETFQAIVVKWTDSGKIIAWHAWNFEVAEFWVKRAVDQSSARENTSPNPGADGDVDDIVQSGRGSSLGLSPDGRTCGIGRRHDLARNFLLFPVG